MYGLYLTVRACIVFTFSAIADYIRKSEILFRTFAEILFTMSAPTIVSIYTEMTPNPETMKFVANKLLYPGKSIDFPEENEAGPSPLAQELFGFLLYAVYLLPAIL